MPSDPEGELAALIPRLVGEWRVHFLDNLRSFVIVLVVLHHVALSFGGVGYWYYVSPYPVSNVSKAVLTLFVALNQTFFMGLMFFIAGHFSSIAVERKAWGVFCIDRLKRLGIPIVVYTFAIHPLVVVLLNRGSVWTALRHYYLNLDRVQGPIWFIALLLVFDVIYATTKLFIPSFGFLIPSSYSQYRLAALLGISTVIICTFSVRLSFPLGTHIPVMALEPGYTPQYVLAYISGCSLSKIQQYMLFRDPRRALALSYLGAILSAAIISGIGAALAIPVTYAGGMNPFALSYAIWHETCFYFLGTAWFSLFHDSERTTEKWGTTARYSYGAYIVHSVVVVWLQILLDSRLDGILKTVIVGVPAIVLSWAVSWVLVQIPFVGAII
ncbi:Acyltransferase 3 [Mycena indigotica]|uniref:Acyltransferase 3 n=1 Tax=Mycena indigotica TaxID=2126181 RepID=A0A8H6T7C7_9AGAR|nr:Acyltransferase 3 [Mycena indigotica]KAF7312413.1 Acyltransferase 3 [Mycena indigotica]